MDSLPPLLPPRTLTRIYDVVKDAGIDVSAWHEGKGDFRTNPKFCYRWAFVGSDCVLLCIWFREVRLTDDSWMCIGNARRDQMEREALGSDHWDPAVRNRTKRWAMSSYQMDEAMKHAFRNKLPVRVCIIDSKTDASELEASTADYRELDPAPWKLSYDMMTGDFEVVRVNGSDRSSPHLIQTAELETERAVASDPVDEDPLDPDLPEITPTSYGVGVVDQFIDEPVHQPATTTRIERERSARVRQFVMLRSNGLCEWCGSPGFLKHDGQIYLESHHVIALSNDGADHIDNVIALCPNDHRMAHYGEHRDSMAQGMLVRIKERLEQHRLQNQAS